MTFDYRKTKLYQAIEEAKKHKPLSVDFEKFKPVINDNSNADHVNFNIISEINQSFSKFIDDCTIKGQVLDIINCKGLLDFEF